METLNLHGKKHKLFELTLGIYVIKLELSLKFDF